MAREKRGGGDEGEQAIVEVWLTFYRPTIVDEYSMELTNGEQAESLRARASASDGLGWEEVGVGELDVIVPGTGKLWSCVPKELHPCGIPQTSSLMSFVIPTRRRRQERPRRGFRQRICLRN